MSSNEQPSGWAIGWTAFAGITMIMAGIFWAITGLVAVFNSEFFVVTQRWIFEFDISTWGWVHLILGIIIAVAGGFLFKGAVWARVVGVIIAVVSGLIAFTWLPYYPIWAIILIVFSVGIIWALTIHGKDITMA